MQEDSGKVQGWDIILDDLTAGYGKQHVVLERINATIPAGKITVILGGSGCGKSTLLRHIIGLSKPLGGSIRIGGHDLFALKSETFRQLRRQMGVLFQDGALLGSLTVADNVALPLSEHLRLSKKVIAKEVRRVLSMVELDEAAGLFPHELSGGMRKRAGLARAIIANPRILLCDEPTSGLDPITAARMDALLLSMHRRFPEMTIVCVSHDLQSLEQIAEHVIVLKDGACLFCGNLIDLQSSRHPYLVQFLARDGGEGTLECGATMQPEVAEALARWLRS
ncbi:MAG: ATP-binding cassette domain-containing protein [Desulfovibrio sp.]|nr:ATP-binding cassette domain-containing protein [Desulfovibrio sp.]